jgi:hypothetical protein
MFVRIPGNSIRGFDLRTKKARENSISLISLVYEDKIETSWNFIKSFIDC